MYFDLISYYLTSHSCPQGLEMAILKSFGILNFLRQKLYIETNIFLKGPSKLFEKGESNNMNILRPTEGHSINFGFVRSALVWTWKNSTCLEDIIFPIFRGLLCILATCICSNYVFILCSMFHRVDLTCILTFSVCPMTVCPMTVCPTTVCPTTVCPVFYKQFLNFTTLLIQILISGMTM